MWSKTYIGCHVKYPYFCPVLIKIEFYGQIFDKYWNIEFHENLSSGSRAVPYGQTDGRTDMMRLIVAFRNFADSPNNNRVVRKNNTQAEKTCVKPFTVKE